MKENTTFDLRLTLDSILITVDYEQKVVENLRYAKKIVGNSFNVTFWNKNLHNLKVKEFVNRNDYILCDINTKITKSFNSTWFLITDGSDTSKWRFKCVGDPLYGISQYVCMVKHINREK